MSGIDWSWQDVHARKEAEREAEVANRRSSRLADDLDAARGNAQADAFTITTLQRKVAFLEERLAKVEGELRHYKSRDAGFLAEVRMLLDEGRNCPHPDHHSLCRAGNNDLQAKFEEVYYQEWDRLG